jgi:hypothetical protein
LNPTPDNFSERIAALEAELAAVKRREAEYRVKMVAEFLDRGERNTYLHTVLRERDALFTRQQESFADLETLVRKLETMTAQAAAAEATLDVVRHSASWRLTVPLRALAARLPASEPHPSMARIMGRPAVEGAVFTYYLHTSPFRIYRDRSFTLRGWAWPQDGRAITAIRVNLGGRTFIGRHGLEEPEVVARHGTPPAPPRPGFEVTFETSPGQHALSLEAQLDGAEWRWIVQTTIWCEAAAG